MQPLKRSGDSPEYSASTPKRRKSIHKDWRAWAVERSDSQHTHGSNNVAQRTDLATDDTHNARSKSQSETLSRAPVKHLIRDALAANPNGLRSEDLFNWLKENRGDALVDRNEGKMKASIASSLSTESHKKEPAICRYKDPNSKKPGHIWRLVNSEDGGAEGETTNHAEQVPLSYTISDDASRPASAMPAGDGQARLPLHRVVDTSFRPTTFDGDHLDSRSEDGDTIPDTSAAENLIQSLGDGPQQATTDGEDSHRHSSGLANVPSSGGKDDLGVGDTMDAISTTEAEHSSMIDKQMYYGKIIMQVQELGRRAIRLQREVDAECAGLVELVTLEMNAKQLNLKAEELEKAAQEARESAGQATRDLENGRIKEDQIQRKEAEIRQVREDLAESRAKLEID